MARVKVPVADCHKEDGRSRQYRWSLALCILLAAVVALLLLFHRAMLKPHHTPPAVPKAERGVLHLSKWDFDTQGVISLQGDWEFYPDQFLDPMNKQPKSDSFGLIRVPGLWNRFETSRGVMGPYGFGTYRLNTHLKEPSGITYGLKILDMATSYRLFVNGKEVAANGQPGISKQTTLPQWRPQVAVFQTDSSRVEILVHVANFAHIKGGMWEPIYLGTAEQILRKRDLAIGLNLLVFGSLVALGVYHLLIFFLRQQNTSSFFLGLFCLVIASRSILTGEVFTATLFPKLNFELLARLEYLTLPLIVSSFMAFALRLYPERFPVALQILAYGGALIFALAIVVLPLAQYAHLLRPFQLLSVLLFLYGLIVIILAARRGEVGAHRSLIGTIIMLGTVLNDIAYANRLHRVSGLSNTMPFGLLAFVICQTLIIAERFSTALVTAETLTVELDSKVRQRTHELEEANRRLQVAATKDTLTLLNNRYHLQAVIEEENLRYRQLASTRIVYSLIYLDLDNFKQFNDAFGHSVGDFILQQFAELLVEVVGSDDHAYRIGGDEFAIVLPNQDIERAEKIARDIIEVLEKRRFPLNVLADALGIIDGGLKQVTCSIGIATHMPGNTFDLQKILATADGAMLQAKHSGKHQICTATACRLSDFPY